ncbi:MAG: hypothetical protein U9N59_03500 [Campylobacterota bacterium]|nr:hypothetical protein [Campylobacterota bacterium]
MNLIKYHKDQFFNDLSSIKKALGNFDDSISIVVIQKKNQSGLNTEFLEARNVFLKLENKDYFLICYMFHVLFDQVLYSISAQKKYSSYINFSNKVPNFCGFLGTYHYNMNPFLIIDYLNKYENIFDEFKIFTDFILSDFTTKLNELYILDKHNIIKRKIVRDIVDSIQCHANTSKYLEYLSENVIIYIK